MTAEDRFDATAAAPSPRIAQRALLAVAALGIGTVLWGLYLGTNSGNYLLVVWGGFILAADLIGLALLQFKRQVLGISIVLVAFMAASIASSFMASGRGLVAGVILASLGAGIAMAGLPRHLAVRFIMAGVVVGLITLALDVFGPIERLTPEAQPIWGSVVGVAMIILYGYLLIRYFERFNLGAKLLITTGLVVVIALMALLGWTSQRQQSEIISQVDQQARVLFKQIVLTRAWVAAQSGGGVYSKIDGAVQPNPWLMEMPGLTVNVHGTDGFTYTLRNPALVTRELSELAAKDGAYQFHITSLKPVNPGNAPTDWEATSLQSFEAGTQTSAFLIEDTPQGQMYRYMAPLYVTEACLRCHAAQGYEVGQVRGGISVVVPMASAVASIRASNQQLILVGLVTMAVVVGVITIFVRRQISTPLAALRQTASAISRGDLTQTVAVSSQDELGSLGSAFNLMTAQLRDTISSLEQRVQARTEQLRLSADVSRAAASILSPDQLFREIVELVVQRFGYYYAAIFTLDDTGKFAVLREATGDAGRQLKERQHQLALNGVSMVSTAINTQKPRIALNTETESARFANPLLPDTRSEVALPLIVRGRVLGALNVQSTVAGTFDEASVAVLQLLADQIAIAVANARLFTDTQAALSIAETQAARLASLNQLGEELNRAATYADVVATVDLHLPRLAPVQFAAMALLDESGDSATVQALGATAPVLPGQLALRNTAVGRAIRTGRSVLPAGIAPDEVDAQLLAQQQLAAPLILPLVTGETTRGAVVASPAQSAFTEAEVGLLTQATSLIAATLEKQRLLDQTQRALEEVDRTNRRLTAQAWQAFLQNKTGGVVQVSHGPAAPPPLQRAEADLVPNQVRTQLDAAGEWLNVTVPIAQRDQVLGALRFRTRQAVWNDNLQAIVLSLANTVSQATENARLIEQTQRTAQREKEIARAADHIHRSTDLDAVLRTAVEEIQRITGAAEVGIQLGAGTPAAPQAALEPNAATDGNGHKPTALAALFKTTRDAQSTAD